MKYEIYDHTRGILKAYLHDVKPPSSQSNFMFHSHIIYFQVLAEVCHVVDHARRKVGNFPNRISPPPSRDEGVADQSWVMDDRPSRLPTSSSYSNA